MTFVQARFTQDIRHMNPDILIELAARWEHDAKAPECEDGSPDAAISNAISKGVRQGKRECADALRMLVQLLGVRNQDRSQPVDRRR